MVNASWGLHLTSMDLAKIGYLYLKQGVWEGQQLFDEGWRRTSTRSRANVSGYYNYGYFWWKFTNGSNATFLLSENDVFFSWGAGGQYLFVIPHLDLVFVTTAGNLPDSETLAVNMLKDYIVTSVERKYP